MARKLFFLFWTSVALTSVPASALVIEVQRSAAHLFESRHLSGALFVQDVRTGSVVASWRIGDGPNGLPLSAAKLLLLAIYYEHQRDLSASVHPDIDLIIARGSDEGGRQLALDLRSRLGSEAVLRELARLGFPKCTRRRVTDCTSLSSGTPDAQWSDALSLGEAGVLVTPRGLSEFLRIVGRNGIAGDGTRVLSVATAQQMHRAMLETVENGTARSIKGRLTGLGAIGGKTGSTSLNGANPFDGLFAGLVFDSVRTPRYTIVTYARRGGFGGGNAAQISAEIAAQLLGSRSAPRTKVLGFSRPRKVR